MTRETPSPVSGDRGGSSVVRTGAKGAAPHLAPIGDPARPGVQVAGLARVLRGTVAELVGRDGLVIDRFSRRIRFRRAALCQLEVLDPDVHANAEAHVAGITAGMGPAPHNGRTS